MGPGSKFVMPKIQLKSRFLVCLYRWIISKVYTTFTIEFCRNWRHHVFNMHINNKKKSKKKEMITKNRKMVELSTFSFLIISGF